MSLTRKNNANKNFRVIAEYLNEYSTSHKCKYITKIESSLQSFFDATYVSFYLADKENINLIQLCKKNTLFLENSLIQKAINDKKIMIENHIISNKYYNPHIDNPNGVKIKSLMLFPLFKNKKLLGVLKVSRGMNQGNNFVKKDEDFLLFFKPLFLYLFESRSMSKETVLSFVGEEKESIKPKVNISPHRVIEKKVIEKNKPLAIKEKEVPHKDTGALKTLEVKFKKLQKEMESYKLQIEEGKKDISLVKDENIKEVKGLNKSIEKYKTQIEENIKEVKILNTSIEKYKLQSINHASEIKEYQEKVQISTKSYEAMKVSLNQSIEKYKILELSSLEINQSFQGMQKTVTNLKNDLSLFKMENKTFQSEIKNLKSKHISPSIKDLKLQHSIQLQNKANIVEKNIELLFQHFDSDFVHYEYTSMFFELIVYTISSKKGMNELELMMKNSNLLEKLIYGYYFKGNLVLHNEKNNISDLVQYIEIYTEYLPLANIQIHFDENMPKYLIFDLLKLQSILIHLLLDLYGLVDDSKVISLNFSFKNQLLYIDIGSPIQQKHSLIENIFNQNNLDIEDKNRLGLQLSRKVMERLKGKIDYIYKDNYYKFMLSLPVQVVDI